jgi:Ca2+-binding RTX toxin-like protein
MLSGRASPTSSLGSAGANRLIGNDGDDTISGGAGHDNLEGGAGNDIAAFSGDRSQYLVIEQSNGSFQVADLRTGEVDLLSGIEMLRFSDGDVGASATADGGEAWKRSVERDQELCWRARGQ